MAGDVSKDTSEARRHFAKVVEQQGRVGIDADFDEAIVIDARIKAADRSSGLENVAPGSISNERPRADPADDEDDA